MMAACSAMAALPFVRAAEALPGYAIVVSEATLADRAWKAVVAALEAKRLQARTSPSEDPAP